jgi:hypothetical protein
VLDPGFIISKLNKKVDDQTKIISKTPLTIVWISANRIDEFQNLIPNFSALLK